MGNVSQDTMRDIAKFEETLKKSSQSDDYCVAQPWPSSVGNLTSAALIIVYAFLNHDVVLSLYAELKNKSPTKMKRVCLQAYGCIGSLYLVTGLAGYFTWYEATVS